MASISLTVWIMAENGGLFTLVSCFSLVNTLEGLTYAQLRNQWNIGFLESIHAYTPPYRLIQRYNRPLAYELDQDDFGVLLGMLGRAGIEPYARIPDNPPIDLIAQPITPVRWEEMAWENGIGRIGDNRAYLEFALSVPRFVCGIRLTIQYDYEVNFATSSAPMHHLTEECSLPRPQLPWTHKEELVWGRLPRIALAWKTPYQEDFVSKTWGEHRVARWQDERFLTSGTEPQTLTVWIGETIDRFRIYPDTPLLENTNRENRAISFSISNISLICPAFHGAELIRNWSAPRILIP